MVHGPGEAHLCGREITGRLGYLEPVYAKDFIQLSASARVADGPRMCEILKRSLRKATSETIRSHFRELEAMGYGETSG